MSDNTGTGLPTLEDAKLFMCNQIDSLRDSYMFNYFIHNGHRWDSDPVSRSNLLGTLEQAEHTGSLPPGFVWRDYDNNYVSMNVSDLGALAGALFNFVNHCYVIAWTHKDAVNALTDVQSVLDYNCVSNWDTLPI